MDKSAIYALSNQSQKSSDQDKMDIEDAIIATKLQLIKLIKDKQALAESCDDTSVSDYQLDTFNRDWPHCIVEQNTNRRTTSSVIISSFSNGRYKTKDLDKAPQKVKDNVGFVYSSLADLDFKVFVSPYTKKFTIVRKNLDRTVVDNLIAANISINTDCLNWGHMHVSDLQVGKPFGSSVMCFGNNQWNSILDNDMSISQVFEFLYGVLMWTKQFTIDDCYQTMMFPNVNFPSDSYLLSLHTKELEHYLDMYFAVLRAHLNSITVNSARDNLWPITTPYRYFPQPSGLGYIDNIFEIEKHPLCDKFNLKINGFVSLFKVFSILFVTWMNKIASRGSVMSNPFMSALRFDLALCHAFLHTTEERSTVYELFTIPGILSKPTYSDFVTYLNDYEAARVQYACDLDV